MRIYSLTFKKKELQVNEIFFLCQIKEVLRFDILVNLLLVLQSAIYK